MKAFEKIIALCAVTALLAVILPLSGSACAEEDAVRQRMQSMTLREKVGQLFMVRPDALEARFSPDDLENNKITGTTEVTAEMRARYAQYPCGGFAIFRKNILSPDQLTALTGSLHQLNDPAPLLGIDEEGGSIARIANHPAGFGVRKFPSMGSIADTGDPEQACEAGRVIGAYLRDYGFDIDFAPVADVNTNPLNTVIGNRAFGSNPEAAAQMVSAYIRGLHENGILSCVKHYPGHGDTATDTHTGYAETLKPWDEISRCEMVTFRAGIAEGTELVMTAHIAAPNVTGSNIPATMSHILLTEKLRGELGFQGLIVTDALGMGAIRSQYTSSEACIACLKAGVDLLLMPYDYMEAFDGVMAAIEAGDLSEERIDESVYRILKIKFSKNF